MKSCLCLLTLLLFLAAPASFGQPQGSSTSADQKQKKNESDQIGTLTQPSGPPSSPSDQKVFTFPGGNLRQFLDDIKKELSFDLPKAVTIDDDVLDSLRVPKMKVPVRETGWEEVIFTYNELSRRTEDSLGSWVIQRTRGVTEPQTIASIVFMSPKSLGQKSSLKVKAFSMVPIPDEHFTALRTLIIQEADMLKVPQIQYASVNYHKGTSLLIARGSTEFVELAATIIEAFRETVANRRLSAAE